MSYAATTSVPIEEIISESCFMAWCAGYFEGEGTITINKSGKFTRARVMLSSTDKSTVKVFNARWSGRLSFHQPKGNSKISHDWVMGGGGRIGRFIFDLYPFLKRDKVRKKFELMMEDIGSRSYGTKGPGYLKECHKRRRKMAILNLRGKMPPLLGYEP